jgi:tetratricopeptide (TPR) repeat protein
MSFDETNLASNAVNSSKTNYAKLFFFLPFTWNISGLAGLAAYAITFMFLERHDQDQITLLSLFASLVTCLLQSGSGAFVLGTLMKNGNKWLLTFFSSLPIIIFQVVMALAILSGSHNSTKDVVECLFILLTPIISFKALQAGQDTSFDKPKAALDISWKHWLWIMPFALYPAICVPLFLLLLLWKIDLLIGTPSIFELPSILCRVVVFFILSGVCAALMAAYNALSDTERSLGERILRVCGVWILIVGLQVFVLSYGYSKNKTAEKAQKTAVTEHFSKVIALAPNDSMAYLRRARSYSDSIDTEGEETQVQKGVDDLSKAIELNPANYEALLLRGRFYHDQKKSDLATADFSKAIELKPECPSAFTMRGDEVDDDKAAHNDFKKAVSCKAVTAAEFYQRAIAFRRLKDKASSLKDLTTASKLDPYNPLYFGLKATTEKEFGNDKVAIADGAKALSAIKDEEPLFRQRAKAYLENLDYENAIDKLTHAISLDPKQAESFYLRSQAYKAVNEDAAALEDLRQAGKLDKKYAQK